MSFTRCFPDDLGLGTILPPFLILPFKYRRLFLCILLMLIVSLARGNTSHATRNVPRTQHPYVIFNKKYYPIPSAYGYIENGIASWYGGDFHGLKTSNGEVYDMHEMTAAHKTLPMDTMLLVKNLDTGKNVVVRVNDRGPFVRGRIIDLSYKAAKALKIVKNGTARVQIVALAEGEAEENGGQPILRNKDLSAGEFYVQIGSFAQQLNALKLQKRFGDAGHAAVIRKSLKANRSLYRVQVYAGNTLEDARQSEKSLLEKGYAGSFIIAR